jgi:hypothetical protein
MSLEGFFPSLHKKVVKGITAILLTTSTSTSCTDEIHEVNIDGINIKQGITDSDGEVSFSDDQDDSADLESADAKGPISDVNVLFFDGDGFEIFLMYKDNFQPKIVIHPHNSKHYESLTPATLQVLHHNKNGDERTKLGAENAFNWIKNSFKHTGCYNKEELIDLVQGHGYIVNKLSSYFTAGVSGKVIDKLKSYLREEIPDTATVNMYSFTPSKFGFFGLTSITAVDIQMAGNCGGKIYQDDSEHENSEEEGSNPKNPEEQCYDECTLEGEMGCEGYKYGFPKECGNFDSDPCLEWKISVLSCSGIKNYCVEGDCKYLN